jgi:hypothetical protein
MDGIIDRCVSFRFRGGEQMPDNHRAEYQSAREQGARAGFDEAMDDH